MSLKKSMKMINYYSCLKNFFNFIDVSGSQYDRKVSYRKSQRYSCSGGVNGVKRRKNQQKFRDRHQTVLPTSVSNKLGEI